MLLFPLQVKADPINIGDVGSNIPAVKQGVAYSIADNKLNYLATVDVIKVYKGLTLEAGIAGTAKETGDKAVAVLSYDLLQLKDITNLPFLKYVEFRPGVYAGFGRLFGSNEFDWGVSATVVSIKF